MKCPKLDSCEVEVDFYFFLTFCKSKWHYCPFLGVRSGYKPLRKKPREWER